MSILWRITVFISGPVFTVHVNNHQASRTIRPGNRPQTRVTGTDLLFNFNQVSLSLASILVKIDILVFLVHYSINIGARIVNTLPFESSRLHFNVRNDRHIIVHELENSP